MHITKSQILAKIANKFVFKWRYFGKEELTVCAVVIICGTGDLMI